MKYKSAFFLILIIISSYTLAQDAAVGALPASPTATALAQYGEVPVKLFTGTPDISVPLYTIQEKSVNIPITLNYLARGVKVEDLASWVGLGWSLNTGGSITRSVRGIADETEAFGFFDQGGTMESIATKAKNQWIAADMAALDDFVIGRRDGSPDLFYLNFSGNGGQFVFDKDEVAYSIPYQKIKIEKTEGASGIEAFVITNVDGTTYHFGQVDGRTAIERTTNNYECFGQDGMSTTEANTSWHLLKIESVGGDEINFYYDHTYSTSYINPNASANIVYQYSPGARQWRSNKNCFSSITIEGAHLTKIESKTTVVDFISSSRGQGPTGDRQLDQVLIKSRITNNLVKRYDLSLSNFSSSGTPRLRLDQVTEYGKNNNAKNPYIFDYNDDFELPQLQSKAQDHWGFYNGQHQNDNLAFGMVPESINGRIYEGGGDRNTHEEYLVAGTLEKITYPTKGYTTFEYEANMALKSPSEIAEDDCNANNNCQKYTYAVSTNCYPISHSNCTDDTITFTVPEGALDNIEVSVAFNSSSMPPNVPNNECSAYSYIQGEGIAIYDAGGTLSQPSWSCATYGSPYSYSKQFRANLVQGNEYTLTAVKGVEGVTSTLSISFNHYADTQPGQPILGAVGGVRIKRITHHDGISTANDIVKEYEYSDGQLITKPSYLTNYIDTQGNAFEVGSSNSYIALGTTQGSHLCYKKVTEKIGQNGSSGKVVHDFTYAADQNYQSLASLPFVPRISNDWKRGLPNKITKFDINGNKVNQTELDHNFDETRNQNVVTWYVVGDRARMANANAPTQVPERYDIATLEYNSQWIYQSRISQTKFQLTKNENTQTIATNFEYENADHSQLTRKWTETPSGIKITLYKYALDLPNVGVVAAMRNNHVVSPVLERINLNDEQVISGEKTVYLENNGMFLPQQTYLTEIEGVVLEDDFDATYYVENTLYEFDNDANIISSTSISGVVTSYLWGYNNTLPIAKAVGVDYNTLISAYNSLSGDLSSLRSHPNLSEAMVTTYSHDPLVGLTLVRDPNGDIKTYQYDDLGRLKNSKDNDGNILQQVEYHLID